METSSSVKVAVVTGASSGIGAATATALAKKGYTVVGLARRVEKITDLAAKSGGTIHARACDVTVEKQVVDTFKWINDTFGGVDVIINNAGTYEFGGVSNGKYEDWKKVYNVNVFGTTLCTQEALKTMRTRGDDGNIINVNSLAGHFVYPYDIGIYSSSKHALTAMSRFLENELLNVKSKIRVTNLSPGSVTTEMYTKFHKTQKMSLERAAKIGETPEISLEPEDIADAILYILSTPTRVKISELTIGP